MGPQGASNAPIAVPSRATATQLSHRAPRQLPTAPSPNPRRPCEQQETMQASALRGLAPLAARPMRRQAAAAAVPALPTTRLGLLAAPPFAR